MNGDTQSELAVRFADDLAGVDWHALKSAIRDDDFDNGRTPEQLRRSFENSTYVCMAWSGEQIVGTSRILSDGVCNAYLIDVWVMSRLRRRGIAKEMLRRLSIPLSGQHIYLQVEGETVDVYRKLGFQEQPIGMSRVVGKWLG